MDKYEIFWNYVLNMISNANDYLIVPSLMKRSD